MISAYEKYLLEQAVKKSKEVCIACGHPATLHERKYDVKTHTYAPWTCKNMDVHAIAMFY